MNDEKTYTVNNQICIKRFDQSLAEEFYTSIHARQNPNDSTRRNLQKKHDSLDKIKLLIEDAINEKFLIDGTPDFFIYFEKQLAGVFEFHPLSDDNHLEVGYWLYSEYRRKGILSSIFPVMINYAKNNFSKHKLLATTSIDNIASQRLLEKVAFTKTGRILEFKNNSGELQKEFEYIYSLKN